MENISKNTNYAAIIGVKDEFIQKAEIKKLSEKEVKQKLKLIKDSYIKYSENLNELYINCHKKELYDLICKSEVDLNIINNLN